MRLEVATRRERWKNRPVANCYMLGQRLAEHVNACGELKERMEVYPDRRKLRTQQHRKRANTLTLSAKGSNRLWGIEIFYLGR